MTPLLLILLSLAVCAAGLFLFIRLSFAAGDAIINRVRSDRLEADECEAENCEVCGAPVRDYFVNCSLCGDGLCRDCVTIVPGERVSQVHFCPTCEIERQKGGLVLP